MVMPPDNRERNMRKTKKAGQRPGLRAEKRFAYLPFLRSRTTTSTRAIS
jgi:hypothetical protein